MSNGMFFSNIFAHVHPNSNIYAPFESQMFAIICVKKSVISVKASLRYQGYKKYQNFAMLLIVIMVNNHTTVTLVDKYGSHFFLPFYSHLLPC